MDKNLPDQLKRLGFTNQEIQIYMALLGKKPLDAKAIARKVSIIPNAVYRTIRQLNEKGFVATTKDYPVTFQAVSPQTAIPLFVEEQVKKLQNISETSKAISPAELHTASPTAIDLIYGSDTIYERGAALLDGSKEEMLVISIGEPIPPNLLLSVKNAVTRGVSIKMIIHKYDEENKTVIENLKKNGYTVRYAPGWGFHIAVYDRKNALLIVNNPDHTDERVAMYIRSNGLSEALHDYFFTTWRRAKVI